MQPLVLDTNIVLDLFVFDDPSCAALRLALEQEQPRWLATHTMRQELRLVLRYPHIAERLSSHARHANDVLARFDAHATQVDEPPRAPVRCRDEDDQKFIDLAVAHRATLLSKDRQVLKMRRRLAALQVAVGRNYDGPASPC